MSSVVGGQTAPVRVLLAGVSTRAAAESAARAGFDVTAIDAFADVDQHPSVRAHSLRDQFSAKAAALRGRTIACDAVAYGSNFENHPTAVTLLAEGRELWGNAADVIRRVRDPRLLSEALQRRGFAVPRIIPGRAAVEASWLLKPLASGGGHRIRPWRDGDDVPRRHYVQELIEGTPASIVFVARGGSVVPIGFSRQLVGDAAFGVSGYRYCGNILTASGEDDEVLDAARSLAGGVCEAFSLVGVNGIDLIVRNGVPHAIEVNPRWCASMELVERSYGLSVFGAHAVACRGGVLPAFEVGRARRDADTVGKAIVFARQDVTIGDLRAKLEDIVAAGDLRDIPHPGTGIRAGHPVCTVFAAGRDAAQCRGELVRIAKRVYRSLTA